ncbi:MAG: histidine--tRNA ligase [Anaerolineae bacterium]|jgi:histidyl-tRNA synthetase|nr:histidine--tRNA ligase [Anaerolineae bacterium]
MYQAPRGTQDILPADRPYWRYVTEEMHRVAALFGLQQIDTPIFEETGLYVRGVGEGTDIVDKEMYSFQDKGGADITLRPEWTAGVMRAYIEHGMHVLPQPVKLYSMGPIFRYERPQAGRFRQHHQFNVEMLGELDPAVDLEVMSVAWTLLGRLGYRGLNFQLNSTGCPKCRPAYRQALVEYFARYEDRLNDTDRRRLKINPLRLLDSKEEAAQPLLNDAPHSVDYLCAECASHLATLRGYLDALDMPHSINFRLVRGLDYYTKTVFEVWAEGIGAQAAVCGGGRYDRLIEELGGPPTPGIGFGMGIERVIASLKAQGVQPPPLPAPRVQVSPLGEAARAAGIKLARDLRDAGIGAVMAFGGRSLKSQLKSADKAGVRYALIIGESELAEGKVLAREMATSEQAPVPLDEIAAWLRGRLA